MTVYRRSRPFHGFADPAARRPQNLQLQLARVDSGSNSRSCMAESSIQNLEFQSRAMACMHGSESTAARSCKFSFRAGRRVAPLRGSTSPPAFESGYKILEGGCVGPLDLVWPTCIDLGPTHSPSTILKNLIFIRNRSRVL